MSGTWGIVAAVVLLLANAFFVGASFALVSARRSQVEPAANAGSRRAVRTLAAMDRLPQMMAGAQLGITICSVGLGALAEPAIAHLLEGPIEDAGLPHGAVHPVAFSVALLLVVLAHVLIGEMVPKNFTLALPDRAAVLLGPPLATFSRAFSVVLALVRGMAAGVMWALRIRPSDHVDSAYGLHEVAEIAAESHREGLIDDEEYGRMARALDFTSMTAADVRIPRDRLHTLAEGASAAELEALAARTRHMRFPVLDGAGVPVGYVHAKDLLVAGDLGGGVPIAPAVRPMPSVASDTPLPDVLAQLRGDRAPMATVVGAGGVEGVLTLDDVVVALIRAGAPTRPA
ncbi:CNNM domain-containing protein [Sporichthya polymorpha]|uniref:CNNM domain-containing protein n=1 Tax=Sporichthya polymorpha TaxID=35751 RepID=UPI000374BD45|nr:CNNM domain-containing protein [Sporichthya polymorpha]